MASPPIQIKGIEKHVKVDGTVKNIEVSRLVAPGENFRSQVLRVDFQVEKDGLSNTFSTVVKHLPLEDRKGINFNSTVMTSEIKWYTEIVTLIKDFAKEQEIQGIDFFPDYLGSRYSLDTNKEEADQDSFLLLENLIPQGFKMEDRYKGFDLLATKAILKKLALFHSVPLLMKFTKPELFQVLKDYLDRFQVKPVPRDGPNKGNFGPPPGSKSPGNLLLEAMIKMPECAPYTDRLQPLINKPNGPHTWHREGIEPWNTLLHINFWINNIMINPREGKEPLVKIVDFQTCAYGSYAKDLVFFLLTSVDNDVIKTYTDDLLRFYYDEFTSVLIKAKVDLELTYDAFLKELQRVAVDSEVGHALFFTTIVFGKKSTDVDAATEDFNPIQNFAEMVETMNQHHKDKLVVIASEAARRNWI